jgi:hypothetical protein
LTHARNGRREIPRVRRQDLGQFDDPGGVERSLLLAETNGALEQSRASVDMAQF